MAKKSQPRGDDGEPKKKPRLVDHISDDEDEELCEDEAFNSDDERKYGSLFSKPSVNLKKAKRRAASGDYLDSQSDSTSNEAGVGDTDSDSADGIASDDDDEEGDGGQYMLDLLNNLDSNSSSKKDQREQLSNVAESSSRLAESEYSSAGVKTAGLTLDSLMGGIADTKGFGRVQQTFKDIAMPKSLIGKDEKVLETTKAPAVKLVSERASRKVHYAQTSEDMSRWTDAVKQNREAETLDFRPKNRMRITREELVGKFQATTAFEKEVAEALEKAGANDENEISRRERREMLGEDVDIDTSDENLGEEDDDLGSNSISLAEYKKRRGALAKMRALMFYEEQKRHHINKIKSKKYRNIRKKQKNRRDEEKKEAATDEDPDLARGIEEKEEMERMKERMNLRHKNTSKWAKQVLRRGGKVDVDTRRALSAQVQRGVDLRKKMNATIDRIGAGSDDEDDATLLHQARALLVETERDEEDAQGEGSDKGLFSLAFMKRGKEAQREKAKQEARQLLMELEDNEGSDHSGSDNEDADELQTKKKKKNSIISAAETEKLLPKGKLLASALHFGNSNSIAVEGFIDVSLASSSKKSVANSRNDQNEYDHPPVNDHTATMSSSMSGTTMDVYANGGDDGKFGVTTPVLKRKTASLEEIIKKDKTENPWVEAADRDQDVSGRSKTGVSFGSVTKKRQKAEQRVSTDGVINVQNAHSILRDAKDGSDDDNKMTLVEDSNQESNPNKNVTKTIASLSQDELIRRAFAVPNTTDIDEEFEKEKEDMRARDDPTRKKKEENRITSGWGSWAGEGTPGPRPPRRLPKKLQPPKKKVERRKRKDDKVKRVIINEKRVKRNAKFQLPDIPYPFTSREQYEKAMLGAIGAEWNVTSAVKDMTRPEVLTRAGKIIQPMAKKAKAKRAPAKF